MKRGRGEEEREELVPVLRLIGLSCHKRFKQRKKKNFNQGPKGHVFSHLRNFYSSKS